MKKIINTLTICALTSLCLSFQLGSVVTNHLINTNKELKMSVLNATTSSQNCYSSSISSLNEQPSKLKAKWNAFLNIILRAPCLASCFPTTIAQDLKERSIVKQNNTKIRAAFDIGSGMFKMQIAEVDVENKTVVKNLYRNLVTLGLGDDFNASADGTLSAEIQKVALETLSKLKEEAIQYGATEFTGVVTAVFRKAKNGPDLLQQLIKTSGINLKVVSQAEEGVLGFNTGLALSPEFPENDLLVWDIGNSSFQVSGKDEEETRVYEGPWGASSITKMFLEQIRGGKFELGAVVNPVTQVEIDQLLELLDKNLSESEWLQNKAATNGRFAIGIGDYRSSFMLGTLSTGQNPFSREQLKEAILSLTNKSNDDPILVSMDEVDPNVLMRMCLVYAIMKKFDIEQVHFKESAGSTPGLLITNKFWEQNVIKIRAAFDIGSGANKIAVCEVDTTNGKIIRTLHDNLLWTRLGNYFAASKDGNINEEAQTVALNTLKTLKAEAISHGATEFCGIVTAVFRKAKNGPELLDRMIQETGIDLQLVSAQQEGILGFRTALALMPEVPKDKMISIDIGNSSFQMCGLKEGVDTVFEGPWGASDIARLFSEVMRGKKYVVDMIFNPISVNEIETFIDYLAENLKGCEWIKDKISNEKMTIVGVGAERSAFHLASTITGSKHFTYDQVRASALSLADLANDDPKMLAVEISPFTVVPRLCFLAAIMKKFNIEEMHYRTVPGCTPGLVISNEYWNK